MTKITISIVWIISALLAFPPLVYEHFDLKNSIIDSEINSTSNLTSHSKQLCTPAASNDVYILFSAFVSFILPMVLMVCFRYNYALEMLIFRFS